MPVLEVTPQWSADASSITGDGRQATLAWLVKTSSAADHAIMAEYAVDPTTGERVPRYNDPHPNDSIRTCQQVSVTRQAPALFLVTATYRTPENSGPEDGNPLDARPKIRWGSTAVNVPIDEDIHGKPLWNTVQEMFDPPITREQNDRTLSITWNRPTWDPGLADSYQNSLNDGPFFGLPRGKVRLASWNADEALHEDILKYYAWSLEFHIRHDGWKRRILNTGTREFDYIADFSNKPVWSPIQESVGGVLGEPVPLTAGGLQLPDGHPPHFLEFELNRYKDFAVLGIPGS